jgi:small-conductance mechanosensitive channel/CRP-like cAMP-binding protein
MLVTAVLLFFTAIAIRSGSNNRFVRSRLGLSATFCAVSAGAIVLTAFPSLPRGIADQIHAFNLLLLALALANGVVVVAVNPWREDRIPERFPHIVQDAIVIALAAVAAMLFLPDKIVATTAVGAVVVGFALQDTLGNLFAGLAIQVEKPFRVGHWVTIAGHDGMVAEITWRATKIRTKSGNMMIVPNNVLSRDTIMNYSEPVPETRLQIEVGASYDAPPNHVKAVIREAVAGDPLLTPNREPEVLLADFAASAITYRVRVWTSDFGADERVRDSVRTRIYYALKRHGIAIPYPIQVQIERSAASLDVGDADARSLAGVAIFADLSEAQREELEESARRLLYAAGEVIVRESDAGSSMFVVARGEATVTLAHTDGTLARLGAGAFFGEMSLLTGEPRTATVTAATDCELLEISADAFRRIVVADSAILERVSTAVAARRTELDQHREMHASVPAAPEAAQSLVARVRQFLRL